MDAISQSSSDRPDAPGHHTRRAEGAIPGGPLEGTFGLLREGYLYVSNRCRRLGTDAFHTRLMLHPVTCALGADAARMFYHPGRFTRDRAMPPTALRLLQDVGSVAVQNRAAHRHRKELFLELLGPDGVRGLCEQFTRCWRERLAA